jgi:phospholipid/cholesterol/gamma-HCH transport system substrate-binding protein
MATKGSNVEFRVGVIVILGVAILLGSLYWLQGYKLERNAQRIHVLFGDVGSLAIGDRVSVSGVHKGKVNDLQLTPGGVNVEILLYKDVHLSKDARFVIKNLGVMGERFIAIEPGKSDLPFDTASVVPGQYDTGLPEVMGLLGEMIVELREMVGSFKRTVASDSTLDKFNRTAANLETISNSVAEFMEKNRGKFDSTSQNFLDASRRLNRMLSSNEGKVDSIMHRADRASAKLEVFTNRMDSLSVSIKEFADILVNNDGTLQMLVQDRTLYDDLRKTSKNLDDLISDIRTNPRKYINLKVELF